MVTFEFTDRGDYPDENGTLYAYENKKMDTPK